jgi:copper homeostasis protein
MPKTLEIIVTSRDEAVEAEMGGADRLELVRCLDKGGLTPAPEVVHSVVATVSIPVRAMLRESVSMSLGNGAELRRLQAAAKRFGDLPVDGFVLGFVKNGDVDLETTKEVLAAARHCRATFHRAFERVTDPLLSIETLKQIPQIDRLLTRGAAGSLHKRKRSLVEWQNAAQPQITILVGAGLNPEFLAILKNEPELTEVHIGRAARVPQTASGVISRERVAALKSALG